MEFPDKLYFVQVKSRGGEWKPIMSIPITVSDSVARNGALWDGLGESRYYRYVRVVGPPKLGKNPYSVWAEWKDGSLIKMKGQFSG